MRIVNNKIFIARGETPTYSASIIDKDTGAPLIIDRGLYSDDVKTLILEFVVRDSAYSRNDDFRLKYNLLIEQNPGFHVFDGTDIIPYTSTPTTQWDDNVKPSAGYENYLHRRFDADENNYYAYYSNGHWVEYSFDFDVRIVRWFVKRFS